MTNYWKECLSEAFEDAGITATEDQLKTVTEWVEGAHENYGMATGQDCIPNPLEEANRELAQKLERERRKIICPDCRGNGMSVSYGPVHSAVSDCWKCRGDGRIDP